MSMFASGFVEFSDGYLDEAMSILSVVGLIQNRSVAILADHHRP